MPNNESNTFYQGGQRFSQTPINLTPEQLDEKAGEHGYPDFASFQEADPAGAQAVLAAAGMASPNDSGQVQSQVALKDDLDTKRLGLILGGTVGAGALASMLAGGAAAGAAGGAASAATAPTITGAATGATVAGAPVVTGLSGGALAGGAAIPGAASLGSGAGVGAGMGAGAAAKGAGFLGSIGKGGATDFALKTGTGIASSILQNSQNNKQLELQREQLAQQQRQFDAQMGQRQGEQASAATQLDPFTQARSRQKQAMLASLLSGYSPTTFSGGKISGGAGNFNAASFAPAAALMTPEAMQANEEQFTQNQQGASGGKYQGPDYNKVGYGALANLLSKLGR